jgi:hypothetical protein
MADLRERNPKHEIQMRQTFLYYAHFEEECTQSAGMFAMPNSGERGEHDIESATVAENRSEGFHERFVAFRSVRFRILDLFRISCFLDFGFLSHAI